MFYNRRNYISKKSFQTRFILRFITVTVIAGIIATGVFNFLAYRKLDDCLYMLHMPAKNTVDLLMPEILTTAAGMFLFVAVAMFITIKLLLRDISGPLFRMKKYLARMGGGDLSFRIVLRGKDEFKDVAEELNGMSEGLGEGFRRIAERSREVAEALIDLDKFQGREDLGQAKAEDLYRKAVRLKDGLGMFRTEPGAFHPLKPEAGKIEEPIT